MRITNEPPSAVDLATLWNAVGFGPAGAEQLEGRVFAPGVQSVAAYGEAGDLVGLARLFTDGFTSCWIADLAVAPGPENAAIRAAVLAACVGRFGHLDMYGDAFAHEVDAYTSCGLKVQPRLTAVSRKGR
ncbi:MAG: hypothetical protein U1E46_08840 [Hyphomicrobiales bacterium]